MDFPVKQLSGTKKVFDLPDIVVKHKHFQTM